MKKTKKILLLLGMAGLMFSVTSCQQGEAKMPKVKGKEITLNPVELERKLDRLTFKNEADSYVDSYFYEIMHLIDEETENKMEVTNKSVIDTKNDDLWINLDYHYAIDDGKIDASVNGYESKNYTYFTLDYKNNKQFPHEMYNIDFHNGEYKIKKETAGSDYQYNTLEDILDDMEIYVMQIDMEYAEYLFLDNLIYELNEVGYDNLKFYEDGVKFTIELKISLADLTTGKDDVIDMIDRWLPLAEYVEDLRKYDFHFVYVFERNTLVEVGYKSMINLETTLEPSGFVAKGTYGGTAIVRYTDKAPKEINYSNYILIDDLDEIANY